MDYYMGRLIDEKENLDFEIAFYEKLIGAKPDFVDVLIPLGDAYTKKGLYDKGLEIDRKLAELLPKEPVVWYNLACSLSLLGQFDESLKCVEKSIKLGYRDFEFMLRDPDLASLKKDKKFEELLRKLCKKQVQKS